MRSAIISAGCLLALLLSQLEATEIVPTYVAVTALPFASSIKIKRGAFNPLVAGIAVAATVAMTWRPFDFVAAAVTAVVAGTSVAVM